VLSGGGSLGAVQIGALRALLEAGVKPDLFIGCSVGALNAAALAMNPTLARLDEIEAIWRSLRGGRRPATRWRVTTPPAPTS
jgi:NTE family protein